MNTKPIFSPEYEILENGEVYEDLKSRQEAVEAYFAGANDEKTRYKYILDYFDKNLSGITMENAAYLSDLNNLLRNSGDEDDKKLSKKLSNLLDFALKSKLNKIEDSMKKSGTGTGMGSSA